MDSFLYCHPTNSFSSCFVISFFFLILFHILKFKFLNFGCIEYNYINFVMDAIYELIKSILKSTTSLKRNEHFAVLFYLFIFLLYSNLIGLVPFSFTFTSTFSFTLILAFGYFVGINLIGF